MSKNRERPFPDGVTITKDNGEIVSWLYLIGRVLSAVGRNPIRNNRNAGERRRVTLRIMSDEFLRRHNGETVESIARAVVDSPEWSAVDL